MHHPNRDHTANIYANQTEVNFRFKTGTVFHNLVAGVEVTRETIDRFGYNVTNWFDAQSPTLNPPPPTPLCSPLARPYPQGLQNPCYTDAILGKGRIYDATIDTVGLYLTDTIHLSKEWIVNAGFRLDDFERDQVGGPGVTGNAATNIKNNTANVKADLFSWNASILYKPSRISSFYVAYATSQSPIGSELDSTGAVYNGLSPTLVNVPPQEARSIEVGTKWALFDGRLLATAALFRTDVDHARTNENPAAGPDPSQPAPDPSKAFAGKYRVQGIELGVAGNITNAWSVFGGLVLLDTEVLKSGTAQASEKAGQHSVGAILCLQIWLTEQFAVTGAATYGGEAGPPGQRCEQPTVDWWRFDAFAEYKLTPNMTAQLAGLNLTNELYYDAIYQAPNDPGTFAFVAPGRAGYLTLKWKY